MQRFFYLWLRICSFCFLLFISFNVHAQDERYSAAPLRGNQLAPDSSSVVMDTVYFNPALKPLQTTYNVKNLITFQLDESYRGVLPDEFDVSIQYEIHYTYDNNGTPATGVTDPITLGISYSKFTTYGFKDIDVHTDGWYQAEVKILSITANTGNLNDFINALMLTNEILVTRSYNFSCSSNMIQSIFSDTSSVSTKGELKVYWQPERAATEYDLEWSYIDDSALANYYNGSTPDPNKIFTNNATRVNIHQEEYYIPLLYEGSGHLFYRVRAVQVQPNNQRFESNWSSDFTNGMGNYAFAGLDTALNWQASTSFAEEGKRKSVVQYFDGSLKSRQTVTKDNTTDTTIVAETFYDYQGRPVIQVMPTPSLSSIIKYTPGFNKSINGAEYTKDLYDGLLQDSCYCKQGAPAMDSAYGAARYYSPNNPLVNTGRHQYIPNAHGFVFSETRYTADNTGRISQQSGVGAPFSIDSGRATQYTYNAADQEELDALFGTEVGNASHYFKNTVRDANGQVSISYVDMHGRTIATALAGTPVADLDALPSNNSIWITKNLIDSNSNVIKGMTIENSKGLVVTKAGQHRFRYSLLPDSISVQTCDNNTICYDCIYDLQITITDECNNATLNNNGQPIVITRTNYHLDTLCNVIENFPAVDTTVYLREGSYLVTKTLTINKSAMEYYRDSIFLKRNTCRTFEQTVLEQKQLLQQTMQCGTDCPDCNNVNLGVTIREQMLADVTPPYGQYANPDNIDHYSIFSKDEGTPPYQLVTGQYTDENGQAENPDPAGLDQATFIAEFKDTWAETLLPMHPEYPKLQKYEQLATSNAWDVRFQNTETFQAAVDSGFLNPGDFSSHPNGSQFGYNASHRDPFFTDYISDGTISSSYKSQMQDSLLRKANDGNGNPISMWALATIMAHCPDRDADCMNRYASSDSAFAIGCSGDLDMAWKYFRDMYLQEKREIIAQVLHDVQINQPRFTYLNDLATKHYTNFYDPAIMPAGSAPVADTAAATDSLNTFISDNCAAYVQQWWEELKPCNYTSADSAVIIPQLIQVCREGGDMDHLFGASTVKPSSSNQYRSFEDVLKAYNAAHGKSYDAACNVYLIDAPLPYDQQPVYYNKPVYQKPDSCECTTISSLYQQYQLQSTAATFADYLYRTTGTTMSNGALDTLRMACNGQINCSFLSTLVSLPPALQCGGKHVCADCIAVDTLYTNYKRAFPDALPAYSEDDSTQRYRNQLFATYMNQNLGFSKTAQEYLAFIDTCQVTSVQTLADSLRLACDRFRTLYQVPSTSVPTTQYKGDTTDWIMYPEPDFPLSWNESIQNGILTFPSRIQSNPGFIHYYYNKPLLIPDNGLSIELRFKFPMQDSTNCAYPNFQFQLRPQGGWVNALFFTKSVSCGKTYGAFDLADSTHPGHLITNYPEMAINMQDWVKMKMVILKNKYQVYVADTLLMEVPYTGTLTTLNSFGFFYGTGTAYGQAVPYIDYVRVYNGCNELALNQEFNSVNDLVLPDLSIRTSPDDYKTAFTGYFNQYKNTSYSAAQVDSLYSANNVSCGCHATACDTLQQICSDWQEKKWADSSHFTVWQIYTGPVYGSMMFANGVAHVPDSLIATDYGAYYQKTDTICTGNVFTVETRCKRPARDININSAIHFTTYFSDDAGNTLNGPIFYQLKQNPTATDTAFVLAKSGEIGYGREGTYTPPANQFIPDFSDWVTIKMTHGDDSIWRVYYNDTLVSERYTPNRVNRITGLRVIFQGTANNGYVDYFKVYDKNNQLQYVEDFEDNLQSPSNEPAAFTCSDVQAADFANYFNQVRGTGYTPAQIDSVYSAANCSCNNISVNCDTLSAWLSDYQKYGGIPHLDASGADTTRWKVDFGGWNYTAGVPLGEIVKNGVMSLPAYYADTLTGQDHVDYDHIKDTLCLNAAGFTFETRIKLPDSLIASNWYGASWWLRLYADTATTGQILVGTSPTDGTGVAVCTHSEDSKDTCASENVPGQHFNDWRVLKLQFRGQNFKYYIDDSLLAQRTLDAPMTKLYGYSITPWGLKGQIDYVRIYDTTGKMLYDEEFDDVTNLAIGKSACGNCEASFTDYYNQRNNSSLSWEEIQAKYTTSCSLPLQICGNTSLPLTLCGNTEPVFAPAALLQPQRTPCDDSTLFVNSTATLIQDAYTDSITGNFSDRYLAKCMSARYHESFSVQQPVSEYHYTLYYYDQAGNLIKTVPPQGVDVSKFDHIAEWSDSVETARRNRQVLTPNHGLPTQYRFNTLNQVVAQQSPDGGLAEFWYDRLGRLAISRNARQRLVSTTEDNRLYSYTNYDVLGRITEVGQVSNTIANGGMTDNISRNETALNGWLTALNNRRGQITSTTYDLPYPGFDGAIDARLLIGQRNLRNRVSYTTYTDSSLSGAAYNQGTFYTYDILGNVDTLLQDYGSSGVAGITNIMNANENRFKKITYRFDLVSGKVNMVMYQHGWKDGFFHRYSYDAENRLTAVETSTDSLVWEKDARYEYYHHGPLARTVLGDQQVQGIDYTYTLQGWLKGINATSPPEGTAGGGDMGGDGNAGSINQYTATDAIGLTLNYFGKDYTAISNKEVFPGYSGLLPVGEYRPLYNGNISSASIYQKRFEDDNFPGGPLIFYNYKYDQLNRLTRQDAYNGFSNNTWTLNPMGDYLKERIAYDANGNILKYLRKSIGTITPGSSADMDSLNYYYYPNTNQLRQITDNVPDNGYVNKDNLIADIDNQPDNNYGYDAIGNLIKDSAEKITNVEWNVYGKIKKITRIPTANAPASTIEYAYDAMGNRISQVIITGDTKAYTWYVRDAQGNILTTYTAQGSSTDDVAGLDLKHDELYMYGSSRLGSYTIGESVDGGPDDMQFYHGTGFNRGQKQYELTNHLGNVLATISDRKFAVPSDTNSSLIDHYNPDIRGAQDYYPFGMLSRVAVPNDGGTYRFGFNGKMMDNEVKGVGNQINYGDRILDTRVGRFLSLDPLQTKFPFLSPYQYCSNSPIDGVDLDGRERVDFRLTIKDGAPQLDKTGEGPRTQRLLENFFRETEIPLYFRIEYQGQHYLFSDAPGVREYGNNLDIRDRPVYPLERMPEFFKNPSQFVSTEGKKEAELHDHLVLNYKLLLFSGMATPRNLSKTPTEEIGQQATSASSGNTAAAETNASSNRPSWQQTEADVVTPDYREQVAFKNGNEVPNNTRGSVRPEGYQPGASIEAKNYNLTTERGISSMIRNVTKQVRQRQANLPTNTTQNIVLDVRGQNLTTKQLMTIRSRLMTQTGTKKVNVSFKTQ